MHKVWYPWLQNFKRTRDAYLDPLKMIARSLWLLVDILSCVMV
jgi:hypothetical protein